MAENKKSFIAYADWYGTFKSLPDEVAGKLIKHVFSYVNDENPTTEDFVVNALFEQIKCTLKRDLQRWEEQRKQRKMAGKKSAELRAIKSNERSISFNEIHQKEAEINNDEVIDTAETTNPEPIDNPNVDTEMPKLLISKKQQAINKRLENEKAFGLKLAEYVETYSKEMIREFYDYWREPTKSGHKMKWENEDTWSLELRLQKWQRNDDRWNKNNPTKKETNELSEGAQNLKKLISNTQS